MSEVASPMFNNVLRVEQNTNDLIYWKNLAQQEQTIIVPPGNYYLDGEDEVLNKDGIKWFFDPGAVVHKNGTNSGIIDDTMDGMVNFEIHGGGIFKITDGDAH